MNIIYFLSVYTKSFAMRIIMILIITKINFDIIQDTPASRRTDRVKPHVALYLCLLLQTQ